MDREKLQQARIVVVDDQESNVALLEQMLAVEGFGNVVSTTNSAEVVAICAETPPDLILLDLLMPDPDGFEVMELLRPWREGRWFPILVLTADATSEAHRRALASGAKDFVTKPFDTTEVLLRIENLLEVRFLQRELRSHSLRLEEMVEARTRDLNEARLEILRRLALAGEYRDDSTGEHAERVGRTSALIAHALDRPADEVELIRHAATLHDIGKIGIPDQILLKPGKLTEEEYAAMKSHVEVSRRILSGSRSRLLQMSEEIALSHHEKWDGSGYPAGLEGDEIPLSGRIVAVGDVFDALVHDRPYKKAWAIPAAVEEIRSSAGQHFDPAVVEAFEGLDHAVLVEPIDFSGGSAGTSSPRGNGTPARPPAGDLGSVTVTGAG